MDRWHEAGMFKPRGGEGYTTAGRNNDLTRAGIKAKTELFSQCKRVFCMDFTGL